MNAAKIDFDALKRPHWTPDQVENAKLVLDFVQHIMNDHDFEYIKTKFGEDPYVQHNRNMNDGVDGVIEYLKAFVKSFPEFSYDVKSVTVDGNLVNIHSHATVKSKHRGNQNKGLNIIDTWKVENGKLVEHWDAVQPIDLFMRLYAAFAGGQTRNPNGFY